MSHIPYKGTGPALTDSIAGSADQFRERIQKEIALCRKMVADTGVKLE